MANVISFISDKIMWGIPMIVLLFGTHLYMTYKTGFVQKYVFKGIKLSLQGNTGKKGDLSIFGSLMTALSSTIGTGNIIGVGTAVALGGPGAILWTWLGGIFGIATKYSESLIAVKYRRKNQDGSYTGGAMLALEHLNKPLLAKLFAIFCALGAFGIGCSSQANSIAAVLDTNFSINKIITGAILCVLTILVVFGGVKSIARVCEKLVPVMSIVYTIGCIYILIYNHAYLWQTISLIVSSAFTTKALGGGFIGSTMMIAMRYGIARGLFSNEAGMGSAPQATAAGETQNAPKSALVGSTGVFWDTVVVCLLTGMVLCSCVIAHADLSAVTASGEAISGSDLVSICFNTIPFVGKPLLVFGVLTFAYSTILGWSYFGENCIRYLLGDKSIQYYRIAWIVIIFVGAVSSLTIVWNVADILNAAMCIPNVIAILLLRNVIAKETRYYLDEGHLEEEDPTII